MRHFILCILMFGFYSAKAQLTKNDVVGTWLTQDEQAKIEIFVSKKGEYLGKIVWLSEPIDSETNQPLLDKYNPDKSKTSDPVLNSVILYGFTYDDGEFVDGQVYDSSDGKTYTGKMWLENKNVLKLRGYWGFFYRTETWTKVN